MKTELPTSEVVRRCGGTCAVARMCDLTPPSVSGWIKHDRIPKGWLRYLKTVRPDVFDSDLSRNDSEAG